jgi:hypothetical protein
MDFVPLIGPPPLTPPFKGEGNSETLAPPSPLKGGVRGGGSGKAGKMHHVHFRCLQGRPSVPPLADTC